MSKGSDPSADTPTTHKINHNLAFSLSLSLSHTHTAFPINSFFGGGVSLRFVVLAVISGKLLAPTQPKYANQPQIPYLPKKELPKIFVPS